VKHLKNFLKKEDMKYVCIGICLILFYWALDNIDRIAGVASALISLLMPFIVGGVIAFILNVPMRQIERHLFQGGRFRQKKFDFLRRICAYLLTLIIVIAIITMALFVVIPQLVYTISDLVKMIPQQVQNLQSFLIEQFKAYPQLEEQLTSTAIDWDSVIKSAADFVTTGTKGLITGSLGAVTSIISGVTTFFIGFVFSIYVLFQKEKLGSQAKKVVYAFFSEKRADKIIEIAKLSEETFASFLSGQCLEAVILGSMFCITMLIIRLPYAVLIGIVIAITALIPIVGAFIGCAVGVILIGLVSPVKAVVFVIMFIVLQQIEGNLIYPHVVGSSVGLPGIWVLFAVTVGGNLFGIAGMLTFIPICSICYALFRVYVNDRLEKKKMQGRF
jgi:predicted PurR-regulated permease PerM